MKKILLGFLLIMGTVLAMAQNAAVNNITTSYISLKNALVGSNAALAKSRSVELLTALSVPVTGLSPAQQKLMTANRDKLKFDSRHISESSNVDHQREHFSSLSKNMYALLSGLKMNSTTLYQQYCPMKKASWLSETANVRNPYYGAEMMECGRVTATLKGK